ncbi:MAG: hypothetical protein ACRETB_03990, partial [Steroidobacteraceae bacterium]
MQHYLAALEARDARRLRIGPRLRYTENTRELPLGSGLWRTLRGRKAGGHTFVDLEHGQVEHWGVVDEMGAEAIFGVRLRVEGRLITEVETLVVRGGGSFFEPAVVVAPHPAFHEVLPSGERTPRARLVEIANLYFDAIEQSDGSRLPVADDCRRLVNGVVDSMLDPREAPAGEGHRALGVAEQMTARHYAYIEALRARRYPIVDEARGLVVCHVLFDHPGDLERSDGTLPFRSPNSMLAFEAFKARRGVLEEVWAIGTALPYGIDAGWEA